MGYLGAPVAEEYGGRSLDYVSYGLIVEEIGRGDSSARTVVSVQTSLVAARSSTGEPRSRSARSCPSSARARRRLLRAHRARHRLGRRLPVATRATRVNGGWKISGSKMFISLGNHAKVAMIFAQTDPEKKHRGLACFLVPTDRPGFSAQEIHGKLGLRASDTAELALDEVEVSGDEMLGDIGDGFKIAMSALDRGRYSVAAGCVGICQGCVNASVSYSKERRQFDRPVASFQLVQELIADMLVDTDAARLLVWRAGHLKDRKRPNTPETSIAKFYATEAAVRCANPAIQVHGGYGYVDEYPVERYMRDARVTTLYEGTSQIQKLIIGRDATGINALIPK